MGIVDTAVHDSHDDIIAAGRNLPGAEQVNVRSGYGIRAAAIIMVMPLLRQIGIVHRIFRR